MITDLSSRQVGFLAKHAGYTLREIEQLTPWAAGVLITRKMKEWHKKFKEDFPDEDISFREARR